MRNDALQQQVLYELKAIRSTLETIASQQEVMIRIESGFESRAMWRKKLTEAARSQGLQAVADEYKADQLKGRDDV